LLSVDRVQAGATRHVSLFDIRPKWLEDATKSN
jgi:hypothetical protein